ncbi:MAG: glutamate-cysteine ligase family protein [Gammaproteobacteria bacterium]
MNAPPVLHLFEGFGLELEYMLVHRETLAVFPWADELLRLTARTDGYVQDVARGPVAWSNELVCHVLELKTNGPASSLGGLDRVFHEDVAHINGLLAGRGAMLLGTGAHPLMDPATDTRLWSHGDRQIYSAYDRIFGCRGHGWSNLQSTHLNLPFCGDEEFGRLHAAVRLVLPLIPALAASSPLLDGQPTGYLDSRLETYRHNQARIPSIAGRIIPERLFTRGEYDTLFERLRTDVAPHDPDGILEPVFLNSRGAIARFDRNAIEIRLLDIQECPQADLAVAAAVVSATRHLVDETHVPVEVQQEWPEDLLSDILLAGIRDGDAAVIRDADYLRMFGIRAGACSAGQAWRNICENCRDDFDDRQKAALGHILSAGPLARRVLRSLGARPSREVIVSVYRDLGGCLADNRLFG